MTEINEVDQRVLSALSGADRIQALIRDAGYATQRDLAIELGVYVGDLSNCIHGRKPHEAIRTSLAEKLGLARDELDRLIDQAD